MKDKSLAAIVGGAIGLVILYLVFWPAAIIWSLNTLFGFAIPFTFKTWVAAGFLAGAVRSNSSSNS